MKKKIAFIWDFPVSAVDFHAWNDGLSMALRIMAHDHDVEVLPIATQDTKRIYDFIELHDPDLILCWGSLDRPSFGAIRQFDKPTALCFAGGRLDHGNRNNFDTIFVENQEYFDEFKKMGTNVRRAFGVNETLFLPTINLYKHFKAIYPAAFIGWKRHEIYAEAVGELGLAVGALPDGVSRESLDVCFQYGVMVIPQVPYEVLPFMIAQCEAVVIPAQAGSQRTVLEAMSMNKPVIVASDNTKNCEYIRASGVGLMAEPTVEGIRQALKELDKSNADKGREFVQKNYTAQIYADDLWSGIKSLI